MSELKLRRSFWKSSLLNPKIKTGGNCLNLPRCNHWGKLAACANRIRKRKTCLPRWQKNFTVATLRTSVSRLEEFASCPFRFFVRSGLRADERKVFELDARERGSFQHEVLKIFHEAIDGGRQTLARLDAR